MVQTLKSEPQAQNVHAAENNVRSSGGQMETNKVGAEFWGAVTASLGDMEK